MNSHRIGERDEEDERLGGERLDFRKFVGSQDACAREGKMGLHNFNFIQVSFSCLTTFHQTFQILLQEIVIQEKSLQKVHPIHSNHFSLIFIFSFEKRKQLLLCTWKAFEGITVTHLMTGDFAFSFPSFELKSRLTNSLFTSTSLFPFSFQ
jgi:hypothetical protein